MDGNVPVSFFISAYSRGQKNYDISYLMDIEFDFE